MTLSLSPAAITRRLRARGVVSARSTSPAEGVVRVQIDGDTAEQVDARARLAAGFLLQAGYEVTRNGAVLTVVLPEPEPVEEDEEWGALPTVAPEVDAADEPEGLSPAEEAELMERLAAAARPVEEHPGAAGLTPEEVEEEAASLAAATGMPLDEARDAFLEGREEVLADDAGDPDPIAGPDGLGAREMTEADVAEWRAQMDADLAARAAEVRDEVYARAGLPTPEMGAALAEGIAREAERLGYASTAEYLWAPGRLSSSVLHRVERARQRAVVEAVPMTPEAGRAHVTAAVVAEATRDPEDARALVDDGRDLAEERAVRAETDEEARSERAHLDRQAALAAALRDQSTTAVEQVQGVAGRVLADATMRLVPDPFRLLLLDRAGHVAALAARTAAVVEETDSYDLAAVVVSVGVAYLAEVGSRTRDTGTAEFASGRVALCARQVLDRSPETV